LSDARVGLDLLGRDEHHRETLLVGARSTTAAMDVDLNGNLFLKRKCI
jgi:hypothetical protein